MDDSTRELLWDALATLVLLLSPLLLVIGLRAARYLGKILNLKDMQLAEWCVRQGILLLEDTARKRVMTSEEKKAAARAKARELAPDSLKKHSDAQVDDIIEAQLTLLKPSIRPQQFFPSLVPPTISHRPPELVIPPHRLLDMAELERSLSDDKP
jgi:hypothetical protein